MRACEERSNDAALTTLLCDERALLTPQPFLVAVVSVSCGLPAIFLLGGNTKEDEPTPILVRSGDVMVLGGESRLRYHGCARVIANRADGEPNVPPAEERGGQGQVQRLERERGGARDDGRREAEREEREAVIEYLKTHRINVNVRQVLPAGLSTIT